MAKLDDEYAPLTFRLAGILQHRGYGWSYDEIGDVYGLKGKSVREYLRRAYHLLGVDSVEEAVAEASRRGLIDLSGPRPVPRPRFSVDVPAAGVTILFVGGPADGHTLDLNSPEPPLAYQIPMPAPLDAWMTDPLNASPLETAMYEPLLKDGLQRRADDGAWLYEYQPGGS
ncbi:helix-turn-helix transcriptional regulator [Streptomyces sp. SID8499]|uniref:helix-turn-helix transcriptional regulator n=1 Tax=Streptomyces sp. SID8499 TaxID=2706106 RepID=UPI0013CC8E2B|nr:helix-turn-helix transcriptional regulator [Streptomyces sp. SID8499]NED31135.1 helix-turn-helix transcriptional regulator [Streptomyces sp. SID8499]